MELNRFREQLSDYIENRLPAGEKSAMDAHLAASAEARADLATFKTAWQGVDEWAKGPMEEPPMFFRDNVMAAIERNTTRRAYWNNDKQSRLTVWERWFPNAGRLAFAAGLGGVVAVAGFLVANNAFTPTGAVPLISAGSTPFVPSGLILPYEGQVTESTASEESPRLVVSSGRTLTPDAHTACDFTFWLENASQGSARFTILNKEPMPGVNPEKEYRYLGISDHVANTLRVPFDVQKPSVLAIKIYWTAKGGAHDRFLFVPTGPSAITENTISTPPAAFTLAQMPLMESLKEVATRTGVPITVEDVKDVDAMRAQIDADGRESVSIALRRGLEPLGLRVSRSPAGVLITSK